MSLNGTNASLLTMPDICNHGNSYHTNTWGAPYDGQIYARPSQNTNHLLNVGPDQGLKTAPTITKDYYTMIDIFILKGTLCYFLQ